jgi:hypothetical protein
LANIFLHEVLGVWFERDIKPRLKGRAVLIRYADDAVLGFSQEEDARPGAGCTAEAIQQIRPEPAPRQDATDRLSPAARRRPEWASGTSATANVRAEELIAWRDLGASNA